MKTKTSFFTAPATDVAAVNCIKIVYSISNIQRIRVAEEYTVYYTQVHDIPFAREGKLASSGKRLTFASERIIKRTYFTPPR